MFRQAVLLTQHSIYTTVVFSNSLSSIPGAPFPHGLVSSLCFRVHGIFDLSLSQPSPRYIGTRWARLQATGRMTQCRLPS